jgi:hypothetical protein
MKHFGLIIWLIIASITVNAQDKDSTFTKKSVKSTQIDILFSYYEQDGSHSAVTGGVGTEKLSVYLNKLNITHAIDSFNTVLLEGGIDIISSASTDNIDMVVSSASAEDNRLWVSIGYQRLLKNKRQLIGAKPSFSIESDYLSLGLMAWWNNRNELNNWRYGITAQFFADDLRWGRLNEKYRRPVTLVYPEELRDSVWFDIYMRYSYNLNFDIQHDINRRMSVGIFPGLIYQQGLLSTPFHRFYFVGASDAVVENLPRQRFKFPLGVQLNSFIGARTVLQFYYRYYYDNFEIHAHTINLETPIKLLPQLTFTPFVRFYAQTGSKYFFPYQSAIQIEDFFTSDYDLSKFTSIKLGVGLKLLSIRNSYFKQVNLRYAYYSRSDGLYFNQVSSYIGLGSK